MDEDQQWMEQLVNGDSNGFNHLYQKYAGQIYGFYKNRLKDPELVSDLHQLTWEKVYKKAHLFNLDQKFSSWLYTIASNMMVDEIRKRTRLTKFKEDYLIESVTLNEESSIELLEDQSNLGNEKVDGASNSEELNLKLSMLSDLNKKVIELRYLGEKSFAEIASELNLSEPNVRKIISRSLKKMKGSGL
jgi:RNA polymerase sigma factor (sigma-70 family)